MDPYQTAVDASYTAHGVAGILDPDGAAVPVCLLPGRSDVEGEIVGLTIRNTAEEGGMWRIRARDWSGRSKGAILEIQGQRRRVQGEPKVLGVRRLEWLLNTVEVP